jgi:hypothetical protein
VDLSLSNITGAVELLPPQQLSLCLLMANLVIPSARCMYDWGNAREGGRTGMLSFDVISIALVMVLEFFVCDERLGLRIVYVKSGTNV